MNYRIDLFAVFIFLGIVQAFFLCFFFLSTENRKKQFNVFQGLLLISVACCLLEIFLMYTGYIRHILHLVDFSEPMALLIGPFLYLFVISLAKGTATKKQILTHLSFPLLYTITLIPFLTASKEFKYNAWVGAYHPELPFLEVSKDFEPRWLFITEWHTELVLASLGLYLALSIVVMVQVFKEKSQSLLKPEIFTLKILRNGVVQMATFAVLVVIVKIFNEDDTGDHLFAAFGSLLVYATSFTIINRSGFFKQPTLTEQEKYKSSTLTNDTQQILQEKLFRLMIEKKPFLQPDFSLPELAKQLGTTVHIVSQVINDGLGKSFFELLAEYRVNEAAQLLKNKPHIKIEEIAEQVGYNSKSSFNTAFKKITGKTPSEFRTGLKA
jgi:AraC-like DNA-binding protein